MARLFTPPNSEYLVPTDGSFRIRKAKTAPPKGEGGDDAKKDNKKKLKKHVEAISDLQEKLYAADRHSVLLVFQAMDAAGKDGTIRALLTGINPAGCHVQSFKSPSTKELDHDFLWRISRSHPEYLAAQNLPSPRPSARDTWKQRYDSINDFEQHLARNGTVILKFFLNVSRDEQRRRFLARIDEPESNWKFDAGDLRERALWPQYMKAFEDALRATSKPWAPWYAIPADDKPYMRQEVAGIVHKTLDRLKLAFPTVSEEERAEMQALREALVNE